jgi:phage-related tail fiber protein
LTDGSNLLPPGIVGEFARNTAPTGWLKANGAAVSRTTYAALFAAIGTTFGVGNGSTTFTLPDLRGEFIRGWDDGRGVDSGRAFGSAQSSQNLSHTHAPSAGGAFYTSVGGSGAFGGGSIPVLNDGATSSSGGTEARPRSVALLACIKF